MAKRRRSLKVGDLIEIKTQRGLAYVQYVGADDLYGDVIRVLSGHYSERPADLDAVVSCTGYITYYPAKLAARQGIVQIVGSSPLPPGVEVPTRIRSRGGIDRQGNVTSWVIVEDGQRRVCKELTDAECRLPIGEVWNHECLIMQIDQDWRPEQEGALSAASPETPDRTDLDEKPVATDADALEELQSVSDPSAVHLINHFLYFPLKESATKVANRLRDDGLSVECRLGADDDNWLVLATSRAVPDETEIDRVRSLLEEIASENGGEYDGWEAKVVDNDQ